MRYLTIKILIVMILLASLLAISAPATDPDWFTFQMPWDDSSPSFLSYPNSGPVTEPIRVGSDGHFHLGTASGPRVRLFGINFGGSAAFPSPDTADKTAKRLAKLGFNFVKLVGLESWLLASTDPIMLNETNLDKMFYFIAKLKENGIYVGIQFNIAHDWHRPSVYFNPDTIQLQKDYAEAVLTRVNPYTGMALDTDPVLGQVQFINELYMMDAFKQCDLHTEEECGEGSGSSLKALGEVAPLVAEQEEWQFTIPLVPENVNQAESDFLDVEWNKRLLAHYGSRAALEAAWECTGKTGLGPSEDPDPNGDGDGSDGTVERILYKDWADYCYNRLIDTVTFYYQLTQEHIANMFSYLKNTLGLGDVPITAVENTVGMPDKFAQHATNTMANHDYWIHPKSGGYRYVNAPMVKGPVEDSQLTTDWPLWIELRNTIWKATVISVVQDRPFIISENNEPVPNEFQAEFPLLTSTYANFQDWDGIILHAYGSNIGNGMIDNAFELADDPAVMAQIPAAARVFRNGWVEAGSEGNELVVPFWEDGAFNGTPGILDDWWNCLGSHYCYWDKVKPDGGTFTAKGTVTEAVSPALSLVQKVRMEFDTSKPPSLPTIPPAPSSPYISDTGQLRWDMDNGLVTVDAPRVQAVIGFVNTQQVNLSTLEVNATTDFAAISLVPLDGSTINTSQKLLLTTVSRVMNTGRDPAPPQPQRELTLNSWGGPPVLLQPVEAQVTLNLPGAVGIHVYRLDETGNIDTNIPVQNLGDGQFRFSVGTHQTLWYGIEVEGSNTAAQFRVTRSGNVLSDRAYFGASFNANQGADLAEVVLVSEEVGSGDVVEFDPENPRYYRKARSAYSNLVAGVITSTPGFILGNNPDSRGRKAAIALLGQVPVKATTENGPLRPGDLLVSSSTPGYAMRCADRLRCEGAFIGKALEPLEEGRGIIKMLVMR